MARHLKAAMADPYNASLATRIEAIIAPKGYQLNSKYGNVVIREALTEETVLNIAWEVLLEHVKLKLQHLQRIQHELDSARGSLAKITAELDKMPTKAFWCWITRKLHERDHLEQQHAVLRDRIELLIRLKEKTLAYGPTIEKGILAKHGL